MGAMEIGNRIFDPSTAGEHVNVARVFQVQKTFFEVVLLLMPFTLT